MQLRRVPGQGQRFEPSQLNSFTAENAEDAAVKHEQKTFSTQSRSLADVPSQRKWQAEIRYAALDSSSLFSSVLCGERLFIFARR
jgi:hypothetical protein